MSSNIQHAPPGPPQAGDPAGGKDKPKRARKRGGNKGNKQPNANADDNATTKHSNTNTTGGDNDKLNSNGNPGEKKKQNNRRRKKNNDKEKDGQKADNTNVLKGGNKSKAAMDKQSQKQAKTKAKPQESKPPPPPTKEELAKIAEQKAKAELEVAIQKKQAEEAKRIETLKKQQAKLEDTFRERVSNLTDFVDTAIEKRNVRVHMQPDEVSKSQTAFQNDKKKLKSDLKKCTAFCKKIKATQAFDDTVVKSLLKDVDTLNLTRYLDEIASAFLDNAGAGNSSSVRKLKVSDVPGIAKVLVALHQRYKDYIVEIFLPEFLGFFKGKTNSFDAKQKRIYMRILTELLSLGVLTETKPIMKIVAEAAGAPKGDGTDEKEEKYMVTDPHMLTSFAKAAGHELTGVVPTSILKDVDFILHEKTRFDEAKLRERSPDTHEDQGLQDLPTPGDDDNEDAADGEKFVQIDMSSEVKAPETHESRDDTLPTVPDALIAEGEVAIERIKSITESRAVTNEVCNRFRKHLTGAFQCLSVSFVATHAKLSRMEKRCEQDRLLAGSLTEQREKALLDARNLLESLRKSVEVLAEALHEKIPEVQEAKEEEKEETVTGLEVYKGEDGQEINLGPFDDEETRAFYCDIPDLLTTIPPILLGYSADDVQRIQEEIAKKYGKGDGQTEEGDDLVTVDECIASEKDFDDVEDATVEGEIEGKQEEGMLYQMLHDFSTRSSTVLLTMHIYPF